MLRQKVQVTVWLVIMMAALSVGCAVAQPMPPAGPGITPDGSGSVVLNASNMTTAKLEFTVSGVNEALTLVQVAPDAKPAQTMTLSEDYLIKAEQGKTTLTLKFWTGAGAAARQTRLADMVLANGYGKYTLTLIFTASSLQTAFYVYPQETIVFITQPTTQAVAEGENATFSVAVTGASSGQYAYQWQRRGRDGWKTLKGATSPTMVIAAVDGELTGYQYRCKVGASFGEAYSDTVYLMVANIPDTGDDGYPWLYALCAALSLAGTALGVFIGFRPSKPWR